MDAGTSASAFRCANLGAGDACNVLSLFLSVLVVAVLEDSVDVAGFVRRVEVVPDLEVVVDGLVFVGLAMDDLDTAGLIAPARNVDVDVAVEVRLIGAGIGALVEVGVAARAVASRSVVDCAVDSLLDLAARPVFSRLDSSSETLLSMDVVDACCRCKFEVLDVFEANGGRRTLVVLIPGRAAGLLRLEDVFVDVGAFRAAEVAVGLLRRSVIDPVRVADVDAVNFGGFLTRPVVPIPDSGAGVSDCALSVSEAPSKSACVREDGRDIRCARSGHQI